MNLIAPLKMQNKWFGLIGFLFVLFTQAAYGQLELPEDKVKVDFSIVQKGCDASVVAKVKCVEHWHINAVKLPPESFGYPSSLNLEPSPAYELRGGTIEPKPIHVYDEKAKEDLYYHEGTFNIKQKIKVVGEKDFVIKGNFDFQTCDEVKCLRPFAYEFELNVKGCKTDQAQQIEIPAKKTADQNEEENPVETESNDPSSASDESDSEEGETTVNEEEADKITPKQADEILSEQPEIEEAGEEEEGMSLWTIFLLSFASGLAALLTPCVFPMIPMTVSFFTKQSKSKAQGIRNATTYGISIIVIYIVLGTAVTWIFGADVLNKMSTDPTFNIVFFLLLVVFAVSFLGAFEIRLPSSWLNKVDSKADKGGMIGIFFMALALALVSFSCTGPIVGSLLVTAATEGGIAPFIGMFGFSLALALPFALFAAFPGWMNSLPQSGGWLNTVKVVLGFLELALAFKFLSNADLSLQAHLLERELFLAIWIAVFTALALYLFGFIQLPHDSKVEKLSVGRALFGTTVLVFVLYMIPGLFGAPLKLISAFPPPMSYSESPLGFGGGGQTASADHVEGAHLGPQNIMTFHDFDDAQAYADKVGKPLFIDFTGWNCVNCRKMEENVWGQPGIIDILKDDVVIASLHVDERTELPKEEQIEVEFTPGRKQVLKTVGDKWMYKEISEYQVASQPYYIMLGPNGENLANGPADYEHHSDPKDFLNWLEDGLTEYKKAK